MEAHCAQHGIYQDIVSPRNHKANGLAERYVGTLHDAMTHLSEEKLGEWYKYCEPIAHCLRVTPKSRRSKCSRAVRPSTPTPNLWTYRSLGLR
jgi:hypothetical protein